MENKIKLSSFGSIFKDAVNDFKTRFRTIAVFSALSLAANIFLSFIIAIAAVVSIWNIAIGVVIGVIGSVGFLFAAYLITGAFLFAMKDNSRVKESFKFIWRNIWSFLWITILITLVILPGLIALIIPGLILSIFFTFSIFVFMDEEKKGIAALSRSMEYVKGRFWPILKRLSLYILVALGGVIVVSITSNILSLAHKSIGNIFQTLFNAFILTPIGICFSWRLYKDLKEKRPEVASAPIPEKKNWIKTFAIVGAALIAVIAVLAIVNRSLIKQMIEEIITEEKTPNNSTSLSNNQSTPQDQKTETPFSIFGSDSTSGLNELMKQATDSQRISDLDTLKIAIGVYKEITSAPTKCVPGKIYKSTEGTAATDGTGWVPINFDSLHGMAPIPYLPMDPNGDNGSFYSFVCNAAGEFEIDTVLVSDKHKEKMSADTGNNSSLYEVGSNLDIIK